MLGVDRTHRRRVLVVPRTHVVPGHGRGIAARQGANQGAFFRAAVARELRGPRDGMVCGRERPERVLVVECLPRLVVVGPDRVADSPPGHRAARVGVNRPAKARDRFLVMIAVGPGETPVEPSLRFRAPGRDGPPIASQVVGVVGHWLWSPSRRRHAKAPAPSPETGLASPLRRVDALRGRCYFSRIRGSALRHTALSPQHPDHILSLIPPARIGFRPDAPRCVPPRSRFPGIAPVPAHEPDRTQGQARAGVAAAVPVPRCRGHGPIPKAGHHLQHPQEPRPKGRGHPRRRGARDSPGRLRVPALPRQLLPGGPGRHLRVAEPDPALRTAHRRHHCGKDSAAERKRTLLRASQGG